MPKTPQYTSRRRSKRQSTQKTNKLAQLEKAITNINDSAKNLPDPSNIKITLDNKESGIYTITNDLFKGYEKIKSLIKDIEELGINIDLGNAYQAKLDALQYLSLLMNAALKQASQKATAETAESIIKFSLKLRKALKKINKMTENRNDLKLMTEFKNGNFYGTLNHLVKEVLPLSKSKQSKKLTQNLKQEQKQTEKPLSTTPPIKENIPIKEKMQPINPAKRRLLKGEIGAYSTSVFFIASDLAALIAIGCATSTYGFSGFFDAVVSNPWFSLYVLIPIMAAAILSGTVGLACRRVRQKGYLFCKPKLAEPKVAAAPHTGDAFL